MTSTIRVYLDSNVVMRLLFEREPSVDRIAEASKEGRLEAFVSWLSLTEISNSISGMRKHEKFSVLMRNILDENKIRLFLEPDVTISSGVVLQRMGDLDYSDYVHLQIATDLSVDYFLTYDMQLFSKAASFAFKIMDPAKFVEEVLIGGERH